MGPHGDLGWHVNKLEVSRHGLEIALALVDLELKESVVVACTGCFVLAHSGEFLVGRIVRRSNIVC